MSEIPGSFDYLFGQRAGWACLGAIDGAPQFAEPDSAASGALPYRVRWSEMGQEPVSDNVEPENCA